MSKGFLVMTRTTTAVEVATKAAATAAAKEK